MAEAKRDCPSRRFLEILGGAEDAMLAFWATAPYLNAFAGVDLRSYYDDAEVKLRAQVAFQTEFADAMLLPGIWADYGALCEPSAFGCEVLWPEGGMPSVVPLLKSLSEIGRLRVPDPERDGFMPRALAEYRYFWDHLDPRYVERYGYLDGVATSFGPAELGAVLMGHGNFFLALAREPGRVHALLELTTEAVLLWLRAQEKVNGRLKRIALADHLPGQIRPEHFEEFFLPYTNRVVEAFPGALVLYHNEYPIKYLPLLARLKVSLFHFGGSVRAAKEALGGAMALMGNLAPVGLLRQGTPAEVEEEATTCLMEGVPGGRFFLSSAGGLAPDTPLENLKAAGHAIERWQQRASGA
ncbi:MAG: hypothetical protein HY900_37105 [Deltaproteobacteria bacterium]|nr:hypothetical protein [Deltaproteobacteria bacterium]